MELCIVAIFKNEKHALKEWINHYLREGVDYFFLVDNGSTDGYDLKGYEDKVEVWINPKKHAQIELTNHYLPKAKKYDWVLVVDLDEFMYARKGLKTIPEYLRTLPSNVHEIQVPWKIFGSSGHIKQPKSIIQGFTKRQKYPDTLIVSAIGLTSTKSIVRGSVLKEISIHTHKNTHKQLPNGKMVDTTIQPIHEKLLKKSCLHLNHYRIQSWDWFSKVKIPRGDAYGKHDDFLRNKDYFKHGDKNDIADTELKHKWLKNGTHRVRSNRLKTVRRRRIH